MKTRIHRALLAAVVAGGVITGPALADPPVDKKPKKAELCADQSKKHVKGEKGTAFSRCVKAMKAIESGEVAKPKEACKGLSKKHVKGEKGTPFSRCVVAAAQLKKSD